MDPDRIDILSQAMKDSELDCCMWGEETRRMLAEELIQALERNDFAVIFLTRIERDE